MTWFSVENICMVKKVNFSLHFFKKNNFELLSTMLVGFNRYFKTNQVILQAQKIEVIITILQFYRYYLFIFRNLQSIYVLLHRVSKHSKLFWKVVNSMLYGLIRFRFYSQKPTSRLR